MNCCPSETPIVGLFGVTVNETSVLVGGGPDLESLVPSGSQDVSTTTSRITMGNVKNILRI